MEEYKKNRVAFLLIGTKNYIELAIKSAASLREKWKKAGNRDILSIIIFTDHAYNIDYLTGLMIKYNAAGIHFIHCEHLSWPLTTLLRYHRFCEAKEELSKYDYLYFINADMIPQKPLHFSSIKGDLVGTIHPGFYNCNPSQYTYERNPKSTAYVPYGVGTYYFIGALQGGKTDTFLAAADVMRGMIDQDLKNNHIQVWHDESSWNRYCIFNPPDKVLDPSFCYPEGWDLPFDCRILKIKKDHEVIRSEAKSV